jgi:hypothetical protein
MAPTVRAGCDHSSRAARRCRSVALGSTRQDGADSRRPPLDPAVRGGCAARIELARNLPKALTPGALGSNTSDHFRLDGGWATESCCRGVGPGSPASLGQQPFELVDGNQFRPPGELNRLEEREESVESRAADPKGLSCLSAGVGKPLYPLCFTHDLARRAAGEPRRVSTRFLVSAPVSPPRHPYTVQKLCDGSAPWCICVSLAIEAGSSCTEGSRRAARS